MTLSASERKDESERSNDKPYSASSMNSLKMQRGGLTRAWRIDRSCDAFFAGGKVDVVRNGAGFVCMHDNNIHMVPLSGAAQSSSGKGSSSLTLFSKEDSEDLLETITCFAMHPDKAEIVLATQKGSLRHYSMLGNLRTVIQPESAPDATDTAGYECLRVFKAHQMPILTMSFDPTGALVATGGADRRVCVWDIYRGYCTHSFRDHSDILHSVQFHPQGDRLQLFSTAEDHTVRVFDLRDSRCIAVFDEAHVSVPTCLSFRMPDGYLMASTGRDKVVCFYELRLLQHIKSIPLMEELEACLFLEPQHTGALLASSATTAKKSQQKHDAAVFLTAGEQGVIRLFRITMVGKNSASFSMESLAVLNMFNSPQGAVSKSTDSTSSTGSLQGILSLHYVPSQEDGVAPCILSVTKDHNFCFYSCDQLTEYCNRPENNPLEPEKLLIGSHGEILDMALIPSMESCRTSDNSPLRFKLALVTNSAQVRIIDESFSCTVMEAHTDIVLAVDASPDGCWLVTSSKDYNCVLWNIHHRRCVAIAKGHTDAVGCVTMSQSMHSYASRNVFMVSGGGDKILKRWSLPVHKFNNEEDASVEVLHASHSVRAHDKDINTVCTAPNDQLIASGSQDKCIKIWKASDLSPVTTLRGHKRGVWRVQFSPIEKLLVSCSGDRTVKIWSVGDSFGIVKTLDGHTASVLSVRFVNHGLQLMSAAADGLMRLWTVRTGECEGTFEQHEDRIWALESLDIHPNPFETKTASNRSMHYVFSGGSESRLLVWRDFTAEDELLRMEEVERTVLLEQQMSNDLRDKRFDRALKTALELGHSLKVLNILRSILESPKLEPTVSELQLQHRRDMSEQSLFHRDWSRRLDFYLQQLSTAQMEKVLGYLVDWNMNSKHCFVSQVVLGYLFRSFRVEELQKMRGLNAILPALESYSERHFQRLDRLNQASYMLEYFTSRTAPLSNEDEKEMSITSAAVTAIARGHRTDKRPQDVEIEKESSALQIFTPIAHDENHENSSDSEDSETERADTIESSVSSSKKRAAKRGASAQKTTTRSKRLKA